MTGRIVSIAAQFLTSIVAKAARVRAQDRSFILGGPIGLLPARLGQAGQLNRIRILLGDDHQSFPKVVAGLLEPAFEIIGSVSNGRSLIDKAMQLEPDVIVTDISMPILNGIQAALQLKNLGCASKIVFLSVHSNSDFVRACLSVGALGYVVKPRMATDLDHAIRETLAGRVFVSPGLLDRN